MMTTKFHNSKYILFSLTMLFSANVITSQNKAIENAQEKFQDYAFDTAKEKFHKVVTSDNIDETPSSYLKLADSYYNTAQYKKAVEWYKKYDDVNTQFDANFLMRYAQSLKSIKNYDKANEILLKLEKSNTNDSRVARFESMRDYLDIIENQSSNFKIESVKFNSKLQDFAPSFYGDQLIISSNRPERTGSGNHDWNGQPFTDLFLVDDTDGTKMQKLSKKINTELHESTSVFNADKTVMYFTRNNFNSKKIGRDSEGVSRLKIYRSELLDGKWQAAQELPFNSNDYSVAHPALSADGKTLYFASDMPGTIGLSDIWSVSINEDGTYGSPVNLGKNINTEGRDTFPFVTNDDTMYFSSEGHLGLGGLDVFIVKKDSNKSQVINVGKPINSPVDDFNFIINSSGKGYFASNREGGLGNDDIYSLVKLKDIELPCEPIASGIVKNAKTAKIIADATIVLKDNSGKVVKTIKSDSQGRFNLGEFDCKNSYSVTASKDSFSEDSESFSGKTDVALSLNLDPIAAPPVKTTSIGEDLTATLNINNINFDYNKSFIRPDAAIELQKVIDYLNANPNVKIDVRSHTDSRGRDAYNLSLSERRNKSTREYIINKGGISRDRISGRGYGESQIINQCSNGVKCEDYEHEQNRRSEFIVISN